MSGAPKLSPRARRALLVWVLAVVGGLGGALMYYCMLQAS